MAVVVSCVVTLPSFARDEYCGLGTGLASAESRIVFFDSVLTNDK